MKKIIGTIAIILVMAMLVTTSGTVDFRVGETVKAEKLSKRSASKKKNKIKINHKKLTMRVKQVTQLKLRNVKVKKIKWKSSNKKVAAVSKKGMITALKKGKVTITAKYKGKKYKCKVNVKKALTLPVSDINSKTLLQGIYLTDSLYKNKNIAVSPTSLNMVLGMAANAASPTVQKNMDTYLGSTIANYNKYSLDLLNRAKTDDMLTLSNGVWYKNIYELNPNYENAISEYYKSEIKAAPLDISTVEEINQWISDKTDKMIPQIIDKIPPTAVSVLANALLFEGKWTDPFEESDVWKEKFTMLSGNKAEVEMMHGKVGTYYENRYATGFEKTYGENSEYSFIAILPKQKGEFKLENLDIEGLLKTKKYKYKVNIKIPKFSYKWEDSLTEVLKKTELEPCFNPQINPLSGMFVNTDESVYVYDVLQSSKITMDEKGTKAAAATVMIVKATSCPVDNLMKEVYLDRPFGYIIKDNKTNEVMFIGKVADPLQS